MNDLYKKCTNHLDAIEESYFEHMRFALCFALRLAGASLAVAIHAIIPAFFENRGSNMVRKLHEELQERADHHHHDRAGA